MPTKWTRWIFGYTAGPSRRVLEQQIRHPGRRVRPTQAARSLLHGPQPLRLPQEIHDRARDGLPRELALLDHARRPRRRERSSVCRLVVGGGERERDEDRGPARRRALGTGRGPAPREDEGGLTHAPPPGVEGGEGG